MEEKIRQSNARKILDVVLVLVITFLINLTWSAILGVIYAVIMVIREGAISDPQLVAGNLYKSITFLFVSTIYNLPAIGVVLLFWRFADNRSIKELGFGINRKTGIQAAFGALSAFGAILLVIIFGLMFRMISFQYFGISTFGGSKIAVSMLIGILTFLLVGFGEETVYRAYIQKHIVEMAGVKLGLLISALIFTAAHLLTYAKLLDLVDVFFAGIILGYVYILTKSIYVSVFFHFMWDLLQTNVFRLQDYDYYKGSVLMVFSNKGDLIINSYSLGNKIELSFIMVEIIILLLMYVYREKLKRLSF